MLRVVAIVKETSDTKSFVLECTDCTITYKAGQFITFIFKGRNGRQVRRSYSISSSPDLNEPLTVTVKRIPNGEFSRMLIDRTREGDILETIGASGFFVLPENTAGLKRIVFMAAGSGITPVFSLIKTILHHHPSLHILLIYSNRSPKNTIFYSQLVDLQKNSRNIYI